jgi:DNA-binding GntR family transcriptional regulator
MDSSLSYTGGRTATQAARFHLPAAMRLPTALADPSSADKTLAETAYRLLRGDLIAGRFEPGSRLRTHDLQRRYELGLSPLREALLRLASEGFVVGEGQRGFSVTPVSLAELEDLTRTRQRIEALALTEAIARGDADWEAEIVAAYHRLAREPMPADPDDAQAAFGWESKHRAFHDALAAACGSPWLLRLRGQLVDHSQRYLRARLFDRHRNAATGSRPGGRRTDEHRALMEAVLARDAARAVALMDEHIARTARAAAQWLQPAQPAVPARRPARALSRR